MIKVEKLSFAFPTKDLYDEISFTLEKGQHCAFIGASGNGKSTLIEMLRDPDKYHYQGSLEIDPLCRIGYISQFPELDKPETTTVFEYISEKFVALHDEIEQICADMATGENIEVLLETYQDTLDAFNAIDGDNYENNIMKKLGLAGLDKQRDLPIADLSGGEFKLIQVIKEMMNGPELVIMDEPDVFLDFDNLTGLMQLINTHKDMLLVITHNRFLLNHCFNKIIHLENHQLNEFDGRYMDYNYCLLDTKIDLLEQSLKDDEEIARNEVLIDRLRESASAHAEASKGRALKARVKIQERLEANRTLAPFVAIKQPYIVFETDRVLEDSWAIEIQDFEVSFEDLLLEKVNMSIQSHEKVALIGPNGTGKTTLFRAIYDQKDPRIKVHEDIHMAYFSQKQNEVLKESETVADTFFEAGFQTLTAIKMHLFDYGFEEDILNQKISALSGGEKNILQVALIAASNANLLLLDEPTSHLDTYAQLALEKAISNYEGAMIMISHDYYTIANSVDYVLMIENKTLRKISNRKFRKLIYKHHFDKDYLANEQKKKTLETRIEVALRDHKYKAARELMTELKSTIELL